MMFRRNAVSANTAVYRPRCFEELLIEPGYARLNLCALHVVGQWQQDMDDLASVHVIQELREYAAVALTHLADNSFPPWQQVIEAPFTNETRETALLAISPHGW